MAEAVAGMAGSFADVSAARATDSAGVQIARGADEDALVGVLDEVIYLLDTGVSCRWTPRWMRSTAGCRHASR